MVKAPEQIYDNTKIDKDVMFGLTSQVCVACYILWIELQPQNAFSINSIQFWNLFIIFGLKNRNVWECAKQSAEFMNDSMYYCHSKALICHSTRQWVKLTTTNVFVCTISDRFLENLESNGENGHFPLCFSRNTKNYELTFVTITSKNHGTMRALTTNMFQCCPISILLIMPVKQVEHMPPNQTTRHISTSKWRKMI